MSPAIQRYWRTALPVFSPGRRRKRASTRPWSGHGSAAASGAPSATPLPEAFETTCRRTPLPSWLRPSFPSLGTPHPVLGRRSRTAAHVRPSGGSHVYPPSPSVAPQRLQGAVTLLSASFPPTDTAPV